MMCSPQHPTADLDAYPAKAYCRYQHSQADVEESRMGLVGLPSRDTALCHASQKG